MQCAFARVLSRSINLAKQAGQIARDVRLSGDLSIVEKGKHDFQTEADRKAQMLIIGSLNHLFPKMICIGEEEDLDTQGYFEDVGDDAECLNAKFPDSLASVDESQIVCWVDPLDGTKEYTDGGEWIEHVTVLIGLSVAGSAVGGVIHQPFYNFSENRTTTGRTIWGAVGLGVFGLDQDPQELHKNRKISGATDTVPVYTTTRSHSSGVINDLMEVLRPCQIARLGGSGHKVLAVLDGRVDAYVFPSLGLKRWDSCAPEAIIRAAGGYFTNITGSRYVYSPDLDNYMNWMGALAGFGSPSDLVSKIPQTIVDQVIQIRDEKLNAKKN